MSAQVIDLASRRRRLVGVDLANEPSYSVHVRPSTPEVPLVLVAQPGAVMVIGQCRDGDGLELWLSPEQARSVGVDLLRLADSAERDGERG